MTASEINKIITDSHPGREHWGIRRLHRDAVPCTGDILPSSYCWDDGDWTPETIGGACCFALCEDLITWRKVDGDWAPDWTAAAQAAINLAGTYDFWDAAGYALIAGDGLGDLDLLPEVVDGATVIADAIVIAVWESGSLG